MAIVKQIENLEEIICNFTQQLVSILTDFIILHRQTDCAIELLLIPRATHYFQQ